MQRECHWCQCDTICQHNQPEEALVQMFTETECLYECEFVCTVKKLTHKLKKKKTKLT